MGCFSGDRQKHFLATSLHSFLLFFYTTIISSAAIAQDSLSERQMEEVTVSVNKWEQNLNEVPNKITKINRQQVFHQNPQTAADLLAQSGTVFVQKSQLGGGSPMIRGFATNRVLLVVDGVRMNNAIYRSGNIQNIISIDPLSLQGGEVIFGPGSLIYGSDAIGGVMDFHTLPTRFAIDKKTHTTGTGLLRYASANKERTGHADVSVFNHKWSFVGSFTHSRFDDLRMGTRGPTENYLRPEYVQRIGNTDSIFKNPDPLIQRFSGYNQTNALAKIGFKPGKYTTLQYSFIYAGTGTAPRYDRLIQYRNNRLRFAEWNYGPMLWRMHTANARFAKKRKLWSELSVVAGYQNYEESRIDRPRNSNNRTTQTEGVHAYSINIDANKEWGKSELFYGSEIVLNTVRSAGEVQNITTGATSPERTRYPSGSRWSTTGLYASYKYKLNSRTTVTTGLRYSYNTLNAAFDTTFIKFPVREAKLRDGAVTGNLGLAYRPGGGWQFNSHFSTGYRMPNIDDIGKLFESTPGIITVPNPALQPEHAYNIEGGVLREEKNRYRVELTGFHTLLDNAIVRRPFLFNGSDSLFVSGVANRVDALQNVARATVTGVQAGARIYFLPQLFLQTNANWIWGTETDDVKDEQVPLRHAPPFYGSTHLHYQKGKLHAEAFAMYSGKVSFEELAPTEQAKPDIYAKDVQGRPYSPGWYTANARVSYSLKKNLMVNLTWENITNQRYRTYSSGIVAPGSNVVISARASF